jgi:hypothetical protein
METAFEQDPHLLQQASPTFMIKTPGRYHATCPFCDLDDVH